MASLNRATLIGNAGKDPEVRYLETSSNPSERPKVAQFTLATTERLRTRDGSGWQEQTEWHNIVAWRQLADLAEKFIRKGSQIYVEGRLRTRSWESGGKTQYRAEIVAERIQLLGARPEGKGAEPQRPEWKGQASQTTAQPASAQTPPRYDAEDDLHF